jgi:cytochrome c-type biogenesis protein CcmF
MLAAFGQLMVYLAGLSLAGSVGLYFLVWRGQTRLQKVARFSFYTAAATLTVATFTLLYLILMHDYSVEYVAQYSSSDLPLLYLISTFWAGQIGTFLLWAFMLAVCGLLVMRSEQRLDNGAMWVLSLVTLSIVMIFFKKSPFDVLPVAPMDGQGLNPLLQDFWMAIHPPIMFIGFAAVAVPFAYAMSAMFSNSLKKWEEKARVWALVAWLSIGVSLMMGGYWAYKVLGWGGYWAWDPVENSSLIPWLLLTAQLHALVIRRSRSGLTKFSPFLVILSFLSVLFGTFLTRSGVLADFSVHSFVDLGLNNFLIVSMVFFTGMAIVALQVRWKALRSEAAFTAANSMSYMITVGTLALFLGALLTLIGTSAPLLTRFTENPSAVDMSFYTMTMTPIAFLTLLLLALFPFFKWRHGMHHQTVGYVGAGLFVLLIPVIHFVFAVESWWYTLLLATGIWALYSNFFQLKVVAARGQFPAAPIIHIGLAMLLVGATASSGLEEKDSVILTEGQTETMMGYELTYTGYESLGVDTLFHVAVNEIGNTSHSFNATMSHTNQSPDMGVVKTPHIDKGFLTDLYFAPLGAEVAEASHDHTTELQLNHATRIGDYDVTFVGTEAVREGENKPATKVLYNLMVTGDGVEEILTPEMEMVGMQLKLNPASLADSSGTIGVLMEEPQHGGVLFTFTGAFCSGPAVSENVLAIEFSTKPLISLVWFGTIILFVGGGFAFGARTRNIEAIHHKQSKSAEPVQKNSTPRVEQTPALIRGAQTSSSRGHGAV